MLSPSRRPLGMLACALAFSASVRAQEAPAADPAAVTPGQTDQAATAASLPTVGVQVAGGNGFALTPDGRSRLHVGIDAGAGFDTNPYSLPVSTSGFAGDIAVRVRPRASIDYPGSNLAFDGSAMLDYGFLPGAINPGTRQFLLYQSLVAADLEVNRGGALRFAVGDTFSWNSDPGYASLGLIFNRIQNQLRAGTGFRPGGGALDFKLGYAFDLTKFFDVEDVGGGTSDVVAAGDLDNMTHALTFRTDYKFLPRTGFFGSVSAGWSSYPFSTTSVNPDSYPVTALVGVQGQILAKVAGLASIGYSNPFSVDETGLLTGGLIGVAGQAEIQWAPSPTSRIGGGFQRTFTPAPLYQYVGNNRFYASLNQLLAGRFGLSLNAGYSILEFGDEVIPLTTQPTGRLDGHLDAVAALTYFFTDWLSLGITDKFDWRLTNAADVTQPDNTFSFIRNQTFVLASVAY